MRRIIQLDVASEHQQKAGKIQLLLTNFHLQTTIDTNDIVALLKKCATFHLEGLQEILYDPLRQMQQPLLQARRYVPTHLKGQYLQHLHAIVIYPFENRQEALHTIAHELGHYVFLHRLDSTLRKTWVTELYPGSEKISGYARTNAAEDFAESYAYFLLQPAQLRQLQAKYAFMQQSVFRKPDTTHSCSLHITA